MGPLLPKLILDDDDVQPPVTTSPSTPSSLAPPPATDAKSKMPLKNRVVFPEPRNPVRMVQGVCHCHGRKDRIPTNIAACSRRRRIGGDACSDEKCGID